jgi:hypothetical protein
MAGNVLGGRDGLRRAATVIVAATLALPVGEPIRDCFAYTAAGDRIFPALGILPPIAPGDGIYVWGWTVPLAGGPVGIPDEATNIGAVFDKTITDRLGVLVNDEWFHIDREHAGARDGFANLQTEIKYEVLNDQLHEAILSFGVNREWGGTGAAHIGASPLGATEPRVYFGKGLGDLDVGYLRPFEVEGFVGYQVSDAAPRPNRWDTGVALAYSIPYLQSKVQAFDLPDWARQLTPITEALFTVPAGRSYGARTTVLVAPGVSYAGEGWEFLIEALLPATNATAAGAGIRAQIHISLDFLAPETIGRPLFSSVP